MNLFQQTKQLCKLHNIKPARTKGQNFLIKEEIYDTIVEAADLKKDDIVLEVGPGLGFLTEKLAGKVKKVIAVELDDKLARLLSMRLADEGIANVEVVNEDIIEIQNSKLSWLSPDLAEPRQILNKFKIQNSKFKIVANLPYNITSIFLRKFLSAEIKPNLMVLMLQKEVAERICAKPGKMSLLAVSVQYYAEPKIIEIAPADNFWPKPAVDSAVIYLTPRPPLLVRRGGDKPPSCLGGAGGGIDRRGGEKGRGEKEFFRLVKIGFSAKRKMLKNNLANGYHISQSEAEKRLKKADFDIKIRAQELSVEDWARLFEEFS